MSSTRYAAPGAPLHQNRYASSPEFGGGLLGNLVAKRCRTIPKAEDREVIWTRQQRSWEEGGMETLPGELLRLCPELIGTKGMQELGITPG